MRFFKFFIEDILNGLALKRDKIKLQSGTASTIKLALFHNTNWNDRLLEPLKFISK